MIQENPQYFKAPDTTDGAGHWDNWEDALLWMGFLAVIIIALALYKYLRKRR